MTAKKYFTEEERKAAAAAKLREYRKKYPERFSAYDKKSHAAHREEDNQRMKEHYQNTREYKSQYNREYRKTHEDTLRVKDKEYYWKNKEQRNAYTKEYHAANYQHVGHIKGLIRNDGSFQRTRSLSEAYWFTTLEEIGVEYVPEIKLTTPIGVYWADCYIPSLDLFVEVKGKRWLNDKQMSKIEYLREQGISIIIIDSNLIDEEFGI
jgi:membrane-associated HD superfamily phosphohydrolase